MLSAWGWTVSVAALALVIALISGVFIGVLRTLTSRWRLVAMMWVELFRNIPLLVQVFIWYHVVPAFIPALQGLSSYVLASLALGLFTSARIAEQVRSGIQALPVGQHDAASALGLSFMQSYRHVILPQAMRMILPALTSEVMNGVKNSSVAFAVSVTELTLFAMQAQEETARGMEIYLAVTLLYVITALTLNRIMAAIESMTRLPSVVGAK
jgi:glutamate/aspartate transport system permease protein